MMTGSAACISLATAACGDATPSNGGQGEGTSLDSTGGSADDDSNDAGSNSDGSSGSGSGSNQYPNVQVLCELKIECECDNPLFGTVMECVELFLVGAPMDPEDWTELHYDQSCTAQLAASYEERGCGTSLVSLPCEDLCADFYGDAVKGEPCVAGYGALGTTCDQGLLCETGVCVNSASVLCGSKVGEPCEHGLDCEEGLRCDEDDRCAPLVGLDEPCTSNSHQCVDDLWCIGSDPRRCRPYQEVGSACGLGVETPCGSDLSCVDDICAPDPSAGEPCRDGYQCNEESFCNDDTLCEARPPVVCL